MRHTSSKERLTREQQEALPARLARRCIRFLDHAADWFLLIFFMVLITFGIYCLWDTHQVYVAASPTVLETYKPDTKPYVSFKTLQKLNPEVIGWVQVYGTKIDYPIAQSTDNDKYLNTDAKGDFSLSGCPFLDAANASDFSDANSIIYGHHMEKHLMFGDLERFKKHKVFKTHKYGDLYFGGKHHGLEIFAFIEGDAYDTTIYNTEISHEQITNYYSHLLSVSKYTRPLVIDPSSHVVLLSTCASGLTNKRYIIAAKLTDKTFKNPFKKASKVKTGKPFWMTLPWWWYVLILAAIAALIAWRVLKKRKNASELNSNSKKKNRNGGDTHGN